MTFWLPLTLAAFALFVATLFALVWRGANSDGSFNARARIWALVAFVSFVAWALALSRVPRPGQVLEPIAMPSQAP